VVAAGQRAAPMGVGGAGGPRTPSEKGLRLIAQQVQMKLVRIEYDSDETQFGCSAQYMRGIHLRDPRSYFTRRDTTIFTEHQKGNFS